MDKNIQNELKALLLKERADLEDNLGRIARPVDKEKGDYEATFDNIGTDREDNTTEVEEYTENLPVEMTLEKKLRDVISALNRIENDTYGNCENCEKEIDIERLRANHSAKTCIKC
ncbi:MAG: TraR/DksA C4-type zinc finger protein [Candidatus Moraniibacteriota bacterium]|jgi:RNA polymerase-binding transcription factor DksA